MNWNQLGNGLVSLSAKLLVNYMDIDKNVILATFYVFYGDNKG